MSLCRHKLKKSLCLLPEIRPHQLGYLVQLLQYSHEMFGPCIGLQIQQRLSLVTKVLVLAKSQKSWLLNGGPLSPLTDTGMPSEAKVLSIFSITTLALVEVANSTSGHVHCLHTVPSRYSPVWMGPQKSTATSFQGTHVQLFTSFKVAPYSSSIAPTLITKAQVICARSKENISVFRFL